jgi:Ca2+-transporting ATPase
VDAALLHLDTQIEGITSVEAAERLALRGPNTIPTSRQRTIFGMFFDQFHDFMIVVLLVAAFVSLARHKTPLRFL